MRHDRHSDTRPDEKPRVLHVDPFSDVVELPATSLERDHDLSVVVERSAAAGLDALSAESVDCVVCEYDLGETTGIEFLESVRATYPDLPVVCYTATDLSVFAEDAIAADLTEYVAKADGTAELAAAIDRALERPTTRGTDEVSAYERLVEGNPAPMCVLDGGEIAMLNPAFASLFDETRSALQSRSFRDFVAREDREDVYPALDALSGGERTSATMRFGLVSGGESTHVLGTARAVGSGSSGRVLLTLFEHGRRATGDRRPEAMLDQLLEHIPYAIYFKDRQSRHVRVSEAHPSMNPAGHIENPEGKVHHTPADVHGKTDYDLYPAAEVASHAVDDDQQVMETEEPIVEVGEGSVTPTDEEFYVLTSKFPWYDEDGEVIGVIGMTIDVTEQKRNEFERERQTDRLELVEDVLGNYLVPALTDRESDADEALAPAVDIAEDVATYVSLGRRVSDVEPTDLADRATAAWDRVGSDDVTLDVRTDQQIRALPDRVERLFVELFENVAAHAPAASRVEVDALPDGFYVRDDGDGMAAIQQDNAFDVRYAGGSDRDLGFGLALVEQIADAHGWSVSVTDATTGGVRIEVTDVDGT